MAKVLRAHIQEQGRELRINQKNFLAIVQQSSLPSDNPKKKMNIFDSGKYIPMPEEGRNMRYQGQVSKKLSVLKKYSL